MPKSCSSGRIFWLLLQVGPLTVFPFLSSPFLPSSPPRNWRGKTGPPEPSEGLEESQRTWEPELQLASARNRQALGSGGSWPQCVEPLELADLRIDYAEMFPVWFTAMSVGRLWEGVWLSQVPQAWKPTSPAFRVCDFWPAHSQPSPLASAHLIPISWQPQRT